MVRPNLGAKMDQWDPNSVGDDEQQACCQECVVAERQYYEGN
jgi:hypothetical protein